MYQTLLPNISSSPKFSFQGSCSLSFPHATQFVFSSELRDLGKSFPFNFSCLTLTFQQSLIEAEETFSASAFDLGSQVPTGTIWLGPICCKTLTMLDDHSGLRT